MYFTEKGEEKLVVNLLNCIKILVAKNIKGNGSIILSEVQNNKNAKPFN